MSLSTTAKLKECLRVGKRGADSTIILIWVNLRHMDAPKGRHVFEKLGAEYADALGRHYGAVEAFRSEDAEAVLLIIGLEARIR